MWEEVLCVGGGAMCRLVAVFMVSSLYLTIHGKGHVCMAWIASRSID